MDITPQVPDGINVINAYGDTGFKISETDYSGSLVVSASNIQNIDLTAQDINQDNKILNILEHCADIEVLLVGTGKTHRRLHDTIRQQIKTRFPHISIDEMATAAVCRTFNILVLEDRKVVGILTVD